MFSINNLRSNEPLMNLAVEQFLLSNPDPGVRIRPKAEIDKAMKTGQCLVIAKDGAICGCSLIYKFDVPTTGPVYSEIGTMRITANGYDLQTFLAKLHLVQIYLEEYKSTPTDIVFAVVEPKTASEHNLTIKVQLKAWQVPSALSILRSGTGVPFTAKKYAIAADAAAIKSAFDDLLRWHQHKNFFKTPKGREMIALQMGWFTPTALKLYP